MAQKSINTSYEYIIVGGGQAGCVVASRLSQYVLPPSTSDPAGSSVPSSFSSIVLIEAGRDAHAEPDVKSALGFGKLHGTDLHWGDRTVPQVGAGGRQINHGGGRMLSGGTGVNNGTWVRGHKTDYDEWAKLVGDERWSYKNLLPYFKRSETHFRTTDEDGKDLVEEHGFDGPIHTAQYPKYPLGPTILRALQERGHIELADANSGEPLGVARWTHNWRKIDGVYVRQPAGQAYDLSKVDVLTNTRVHKIIIENQKAVGVVLECGRHVKAKKEVIVCCGALRTPVLLNLSGVGRKSELEALGIEPVVDLPDVGENLSDHPAVTLFWKLKHPEKALALGHPDFDMQEMLPGEWLLTGTIAHEKVIRALRKDGVSDPELHPSASNPRAHYEAIFAYCAVGAPPGVLPGDGTIIMTGVSNFLPTSRGTVKLRSADPNDSPVVDPNFLTTEHDICILREAVRELMHIMETSAAKTEVREQFELPGRPFILSSSDEEIDDAIRATCGTWLHPAGTAAMGKVVDSSCRVKGVECLRVVDASIFPGPLAAHYQAPLYGIAEQAADIIVGRV